MKPKIIAIHLPQFHTIPENDEWWGQGFTEWTNVKKARPLYKGHIQPRIPLNYNGEKAYYDLSKRSHLLAQMQLAANYGIDGFCFYHYWFNGRTLLEKPIEMLLREKQLPLDFMLCWANEPWTRTWDGEHGADQVLVDQHYGGEAEWESHVQYLLPFFRRDEYMKVDGRPVLCIYNPRDIICRKDMITFINNRLSEYGFSDGCYIVNAHRHNAIEEFPVYGDAIYDFEPFATLSRLSKIDLIDISMEIRGINGRLYRIIDYRKFCSLIDKRDTLLKSNHFLGVFSGWDNTPRRGYDTWLMFDNNNPEEFGKVLEQQYAKSKKNNMEYLFINAWNEWGEGAILEPDKEFGYGYLEKIKTVKET